MPVSVLNVSRQWKKNELTRWFIFFSIAIVFTILDLVTKYLSFKIGYKDIIPNVLEFKFIYNKGIIWGLFSQGSVLFIVISTLAIPLVIIMFKYIYVFTGQETQQKDTVQPLTPAATDAKPPDIAKETPLPASQCPGQAGEIPLSKFSIFSMIGMLTIACGLILAGAVGNLYDRIFYQGVRDFISVYLINWPIFNLADVYITIGAFLIIFCMFKNPHTTQTDSVPVCCLPDAERRQSGDGNLPAAPPVCCDGNGTARDDNHNA